MKYLTNSIDYFEQTRCSVKSFFDYIYPIYQEFSLLIWGMFFIGLSFWMISWFFKLATKLDQLPSNSATKSTSNFNHRTLVFNFSNGRKFAIKIKDTLILSFEVNGQEQLGERIMHLTQPYPGQFTITQINGNFKSELYATSSDGVNFHVFQFDMPTDHSDNSDTRTGFAHAV